MVSWRKEEETKQENRKYKKHVKIELIFICLIEKRWNEIKLKLFPSLIWLGKNWEEEKNKNIHVKWHKYPKWKTRYDKKIKK